MAPKNYEDIELTLLFETIRLRYGFDFTHYSRASFKRRLQAFQTKRNIARIADLISPLIYDRTFFQDFLYTLSITVTEMFRDPQTFQFVRTEILPCLSSYPSLKIWHAGCASGQEVYAMAILLTEEKLYRRSQIYATDFNDQVLMIAKDGIYPSEDLAEYAQNYRKAGGKEEFSDYYHTKYDSGILRQELKKNIFFANHNLMNDHSFGEMNLIVCRNVLIYFDKILQERVFALFAESLAPGGFLWLGTKESLPASSTGRQFEVVSKSEKIFKKV